MQERWQDKEEEVRSGPGSGEKGEQHTARESLVLLVLVHPSTLSTPARPPHKE